VSEHRSPKHKPRNDPPVFVPPEEDDQEAGVKQFLLTVFKQLIPRVEQIHADFDSGRKLPLSELLRIQRDCFDALELVWRGLPPREQREFEDRLAPSWAETRPKLKRQYELAKALAEKVN
jgi:hypothetical protein